MNTGQKLVALSGLSSGTALTHLLAITQGSGSGKTVFASQMAVCIATPQMTLFGRRPFALSVATPATASATVRRKRIDVITRPARLDVVTATNVLHIIQKTQRAQVVTTLPRLTVTRRPRITT